MTRPGGWVLVVCLALVALITTVTPNPATDVRRRWDHVQVGQWGQLDQTSARVTRVRLARSVVNQYDRRLGSEATFVVVDYEVAVRRQEMYFSAVTLHTVDERDYKPRSELPGLEPTSPGFTRRGSVVFEVPDDRLAGAQLRVDRDSQAFDVYASAVQVDLGLGRDPAIELGPVVVDPSVVGVTP